MKQQQAMREQSKQASQLILSIQNKLEDHRSEPAAVNASIPGLRSGADPGTLTRGSASHHRHLRRLLVAFTLGKAIRRP